MPEMFKEKYREQILSAWLKVAQDKDLAWVQEVCNWQFLLISIQPYFTEWLEN